MEAGFLIFFFDGFILGLVLSLIAAGLTLIYGLAGVLNIAHGELLVIGTVSASVLSQAFGVPLPIALLLGILATMTVSVFLEKVILTPAFKLEGEERLLLALYMTLAFAYFLHGGLITIFPLAYLTINLPIPTIEVGGFLLRTAQLIAGTLSTITIVCVYLYLKKTWSGLAIRALTQNETGALLVGISIKRYRLLVFILGGLLVSLAGIIRSIISTVGPESGIEFTILGLLVCVTGGIKSISGTMTAGIIIGVVYTLLVASIGTYLAYVFLLIFVMVLLLLRPYGILGERW